MKLTKSKLKKIILEELNSILNENVDDMHEEAAGIADHWRKATPQLKAMCKYPDQSPIDCGMVEAFLKILSAHPVTKAFSTGELAKPKHYKHYMRMFKVDSPSLDPDALSSVIKRVASKQLARTKKR
tara:strand:+ start:378 stop:758 length:381 start_codon:yes stop_codon:yes gene_type:complete